MKTIQIFRSIAAILLAASYALGGSAAAPVRPAPVSGPRTMTQRLRADEYAYMWWANGVRDISAARRMNIMTGKYGMSIDPTNLNIDRLGPISGAPSYEDAAKADNSVITGLAQSSTSFGARADGATYRATTAPDGLKRYPAGAAYKTWVALEGNSDIDFSGYKYRIIESGRLVQRFDIIDFRFASEAGPAPFTGHMEVQAMPSYFSLIYELCPTRDAAGVEMSFSLQLDPQYDNVSWLDSKAGGRAVTVRNATGRGFTFVAPKLPNGTPSISLAGGLLTFTLGGQTLHKPDKASPFEPVRRPYWERKGFNILVVPSERASPDDARCLLDLEALTAQSEQGSTLNSERSPNKVAYNPARGVIEVQLDDFAVSPSSDAYKDDLERVWFALGNPGVRALRVPVTFSLFCAEKERQDMSGFGGFTPILRERGPGDAHGVPTGNFVQVSMNWHYMQLGNPQLLYDMPWKRLTTIMDIPAKSSVEYELTTAYQNWGGVTKVSHNQLCLVGWGTNQLWDVMSLGSIFEDMCYEPDGAQRFDGAMIDDVRPLYVYGPGGNEWQATPNVGGGNFLVYFKDRKRQFQTRVRTSYLKHGPNLTEVTYSYITADGAIDAQVTASTGRTDDIVRTYHRLRYKVLKDTTFSRLAFYQLGSDGYNDHVVGKLAFGNAQGPVQADIPAFPFKDADGDRYRDGLAGVALTGSAPWAALYEETLGPEQAQPFANRGMVIRHWKARLNGETVTTPYLSCFKTAAWNKESVNWELVPPPGAVTLRAGDYVECDVEYVVMPQAMADYYGPSTAIMAKAFGHAPNGVYPGEGDYTYKPFWFEAKANNVKVTANKGAVVRANPVLVDAASDGAEVVVTGGAGYLPMTFRGLSSFRTYELQVRVGKKWKKISQAKHGNDFWQTDFDPAGGSYSITFNVPRAGDGKTDTFRLTKI